MRTRLPQFLAAAILLALSVPALRAQPPDLGGEAHRRGALLDDSDQERRLAGEFGASFSVHLSDHFIAVFDTEELWARERAELLERAHQVFYATFQAAGYTLHAVQERLECVMFAHPDHFDLYAQRADRTDMSWSGGYYSTRTNRIALFDERRPRSTALARFPEGHGQGHDHDHGDGESDRQVAMRAPGASADGLILPDDHRLASLNASKTTHEAVHQLAFNSGLQKRGVMYPLWLAEGLATNFEPTSNDPAAPFGPTSDNPVRRERLAAAARHRGLMPLRDLVVLTRLSSDPIQIGDTYAQSWGLFHFFFNDRPEQLRAYITDLGRLPPGRRSPEALRREFERAFGSVERVETEWQAFVRNLP